MNEHTKVAYQHLVSSPDNAPEGMTHLAMYERGIDRMISAQVEIGCAAWNATSAEDRIAINASSLARVFKSQEILYMFAIALDRLSTLTLQGHPVYHTSEAEALYPGWGFRSGDEQK